MEKIALVEIKNLTYSYPDSRKPALSKVNLDVKPGEFVLIAGLTGSGKSTLCRAINGLIPNFYGGKILGSVSVMGISTLNTKVGELCRHVGFVFQDPEAQLIFEDPVSEIAFGLENLGVEPEQGFKRVEEVMASLRLGHIRDKRISELSGGEKQKIALASVLVMQPEVIVLDEPTSQLDPVSAEDFLLTLKSLNSDLGVAVVLAEHRIERCFHLADRIVILDDGKVVFSGSSDEIAKAGIANVTGLLPPIAKPFIEAGWEKIPFTVREGRIILSLSRLNGVDRDAASGRGASCKEKSSLKIKRKKKKKRTQETNFRKVQVRVENLWHSYGNGVPSLCGINADFYSGDVVAIIGENGSGKTTLVKNIAGLLKPMRGRIFIDGRNIEEMSRKEISALCGMVTQNPEAHLISRNPRMELFLTCEAAGFDEENASRRIHDILVTLGIEAFASKPMEELSCGQRELVAIASVIVRDPDILILDEPTRGLDSSVKEKLAFVLAKRKEQGKTTIVVTHDLEFVAEFSDRVIMLAAGRLVTQGEMREVLSDSIFYTTQYNRCFRGFDDNVVTKKDALKVLRELG